MADSPDPFLPPIESEAAVGQALRRSLLILILLGLVASGAVWWFARQPGTRPPQATVTSSVSLPSTRFTDITQAAGLAFRHSNGAQGDKWLPETMGAGVACFDFDQDGDADLLFLNGTAWPQNLSSSNTPPATPTSAALYRNDTPTGGAIHFTDVTAGSGLEAPLYGMGVAVGDVDGDGRVDVFVTAVGGNRLFRNLGAGRFQDMTAASGLPLEGGWSTAAAWVDIDRDGDLDLFVADYVTWSPELDLRSALVLPSVGRAYGRPLNFPGTFPRLYRNEGSAGGWPRLTDVSAPAGLQIRHPSTGLPLAKSLAVAPIDLNDDGWIDLVVANDTVQNFVFTNRHDGTFAEIGAQSGVAFDAFGQARGAMGIDAARFREDGALGIAIGNFANEMNALYVSQPVRNELVFADEAVLEGLGLASRNLLKFGLFFFDFDLDGRLDVLTANGHIEEEIERVQPGTRYRQPAQLFWNAGGAHSFTPVGPDQVGPDLFQPLAGRGSAYADFDRDGDPDVVLTQVGGPPLLLRNDQQSGHHWLRLRLVGAGRNPDAIGAWVQLRVQGRTLARQVMPTKSYLSQSELTLGFGLGEATQLDGLQIRWPDGRVQIPPVPSVDQEIELRER
jgi:hypothetical protein